MFYINSFCSKITFSVITGQRALSADLSSAPGRLFSLHDFCVQAPGEVATNFFCPREHRCESGRDSPVQIHTQP